MLSFLPYKSFSTFCFLHYIRPIMFGFYSCASESSFLVKEQGDAFTIRKAQNKVVCNHSFEAMNDLFS